MYVVSSLDVAVMPGARRVRSILLFAQVGWCDVRTDFMKVVKVDVDVNEMSLLNI